MATVEIIRELDPPTPSVVSTVHRKTLVRRDDEYFVVSSATAILTGFETLVFPADGEGTVTDWGEVAGGRGISHETAIAQLEAGLAGIPQTD
jgi:hypothetical protein